MGISLMANLTLLEENLGEGKSTLMIQIVSLLTNGKKMPDGYPVRTAETVKPRLKAAGADCSKIAYIIDRNSSLTLNDERIVNALKQTKARLLVLAPFQSFLLQNGDFHSIGRIRTILGNLALIAAEYRCAVVLIGHMNKFIKKQLRIKSHRKNGVWYWKLLDIAPQLTLEFLCDEWRTKI